MTNAYVQQPNNYQTLGLYGYNDRQKYKTVNQKKLVDKTLQGVVVNKFIKEDTGVNMDDIRNSLIIPDNFKEHSILSDVRKSPEEKKDKSLVQRMLPLAVTTLAILGGGAALTFFLSRSSRAILNTPKHTQPLSLGMNMNIKEEPAFAMYQALRNPNQKSIMAAIGVFAMSGATLVGKNFVDGAKDIWVKKQEADITRDLQESFIEIETKSFAGKLDVVRKALVDKANYFKSALQDETMYSDISMKGNSTEAIFDKFLAFRGSSEDKQNKTKDYDTKDIGVEKENNLAFIALSIATLGAGLLFGRSMFKNLRNTQGFFNKYTENFTQKIDTTIDGILNVAASRQNKDNLTNETVEAIQEYIKKAGQDKQMQQICTSVDKIINNAKTAQKPPEDIIHTLLEDLLQSKRADGIEVEKVFRRLGVKTDDALNDILKNVKKGTEAIYGDAPEAMGGVKDKIQYYCFLDENRGHLYNWIMNPKNAFTKYIFLSFTAISSIGYIAKKSVEGIKDVAVSRENSHTEKDLQDRLVDVEIRNFKSKKESAIEPMMLEFNDKLAKGKPKPELKTMADSILLEIKNGPPFVYA